MADTGTVKIKTERLLLRKMNLFDLPFARRWYCDRRVSRFSQGKEIKPLSDLFNFFARRIYNYYFKRRKSYFWWAICKDNRMIGFVGLNGKVKSDTLSLYYMLSPDYWNKGYTKEAVSAVCEYIKTQNVKRLIISCDSNNIASSRIAKACGFKYIETRKNHYHYQDGRTGNCEIYIIDLKQ